MEEKREPPPVGCLKMRSTSNPHPPKIGNTPFRWSQFRGHFRQKNHMVSKGLTLNIRGMGKNISKIWHLWFRTNPYSLRDTPFITTAFHQLGILLGSQKLTTRSWGYKFLRLWTSSDIFWVPGYPSTGCSSVSLLTPQMLGCNPDSYLSEVVS